MFPKLLLTHYFIFLLTWVYSTHAQTIPFVNQNIPSSTEPIIYKEPFFLYDSKDLFDQSKNKGFRWWLPNITEPKITFSNFVLTPDGSEDFSDYTSTQISLIDAATFNKNSSGLCCLNETSDICPSTYSIKELPNTYTFTITTEENEPQTKAINKTDAYYLVLTNCHNKSKATISGKVKIQNSFGFLPGNLFKRLDFYYGLLITFLVLLGLWIFIMLKEKANLIPFHYFVTVILLIGVLHTFLKFIYLKNWNILGYRNQIQLIASILSYVMLNCFSFVLILLASLGWGVTKPHLEPKTIRNIQIFIFIFIIVETSRVTIAEVSKFSNTSFWVIIFLILPSTVTYFILIFWIFTSLMGLLSELEMNRQYEKLQIFKKLLVCLLMSVVIGTIFALAGNFIITMPIWRIWKFLYVIEDVIPFLVFLSVLAFLMILWRPNSKSKRLAYFIELREADEFDNDFDVWSDEFAFDDSDDETISKTRELSKFNEKPPVNNIAPLIIGRPSSSIKSKQTAYQDQLEIELKSVINSSFKDDKQA